MLAGGSPPPLLPIPRSPATYCLPRYGDDRQKLINLWLAANILEEEVSKLACARIRLSAARLVTLAVDAAWLCLSECVSHMSSTA